MNLKEFSVNRNMTIRHALEVLDQSGLGLLLLVNEDGQFERTVTDGDLRRLLLQGVALSDKLETMPEIKSIVVTEGTTRREILDLMNHHSINHIPVVNQKGKLVDVLDRKIIDQQILLSTPHMGDSEKGFVEEAFRTNWIAPLGPNVDAFEQELADLVGIKYAAAVSSGTAAIHLALRIVGVGVGDVVFCSTLTFAASANPIVYQGATPVFIDSEDTSWNMSPIALKNAFSWAEKQGKLPKAVIVVNLYGQSADMDALQLICNQYDVPIIEDAAESLGATYKGKASGTFGTLGVYSFNGNKIITTSGGGMLVSDNADHIEKAKFLATQARDPAPHYQHSEIGYNYRLSNILAGVGRGQLKVLTDRVNARRAVFHRYQESLKDIENIKWMPEPDWSYSTHWLTACTIRPKSKINNLDLIKAFMAEMIEVRPVWKPMHLQPVYKDSMYFKHSEKSVSDDLFEYGICLPSGSNLSDLHVDRVVEVIRACV